MRIGSGEMRGRRVRAPRGERTRPTSGRLKKSLFDVLAPRLPGARVLDLYAGSGSLAFEALSRGAESAVLVERNRRACESIRRNVEDLELGGRVAILPMDVSSALSKLLHRGERFDVVFADPPYRSNEPDDLLVLLGDGRLVAEGALVILEHHHKRELRSRYGTLSQHRVIKAGESCLTLFAPSE
ncbi:MAG: 16S rRNA (guanine(966)-N(2))-methyltransferase RsmD [Vicinamibacteria bacterium]